MVMHHTEGASEFVIETLHALYGDATVADLEGRAAYPVTVMTPSADFLLHDIVEMDRTLTLLRQGFREAGVETVRPQIQTVFYPEQGMAVVSTRNTRLGVDGEDLGAHLSTYIVRYTDRWRFKAISINDEAQDDLRERIEQLMESKGVMKRLPTGKGDER